MRFGIGVYTGRGTNATPSTPADGDVLGPGNPPPFNGRRGKLVFQALRVGVAVALELRFNPVDCSPIAIRPLPSVAELGQSLDRGFIPLQVKPGYQQGGVIPRCITLRRRDWLFPCSGNTRRSACRQSQAEYQFPLQFSLQAQRILLVYLV